MIVDSHCHLNLLNLDAYQGSLDRLLQQMPEHKIEHILCVSVDLATFPTILHIAELYDFVSASIGVHPSEEPQALIDIQHLITLGKHHKVVAVGETGLDYYYNHENLDPMRQRFRTHIQAARQLKKPLIIHTRNAQTDTINIMREEQAQDCSGAMHCFTESWEMAKEALDLGFYISFSGIVTFKNAQAVMDVARKVPLTQMLIETDAPYLTPHPYRGKPNQPQYVRLVAEKIAELKNISWEEVAVQTTQNFYHLFFKSGK